ncbi:MAG: hypothetical protein ABEJ93_03575 [Candidatus Nanohalobium sp.]
MTEEKSLFKQMMKEEWRMHSTLYRGRSFAAFPLLVFAFTFTFSYATVNFSTLGSEAVGTATMIVSLFLGLAVGSLGFSSRDAMKNVLGDTNHLIYSSRTLPISKKKLLADFLVKDLAYYTILFLAPLAAAVLLGTGLKAASSLLLIPPLFLTGIATTFILARVSVDRPSISILNFEKIEALEPIADKSLIDIFRSSGGLLKIFFSLGILTAFYWYVVLFYPAAELLLNNPLISYSVMIGLLNLSVYNWLNRFDSLEDYLYLPLDKRHVLTGKEEAYMVLTLPITILLISVSYLFYPQHFFISVATGIAATLYNLAAAIHTTGLKPNEKLFDTWTFLKYMVIENVVAAPLLALSVIYSYPNQYIYMAVLCFAVITALLYLRQRDTGRKEYGNIYR